MPDTPVAPPERGPYDPAIELRVSRLEEDVHEVRAAIAGLDGRMARLETGFAELKALLMATLPHLATKADIATTNAGVAAANAGVAANRAAIEACKAELKAEFKAGLAEKPSKTYMWGILGVLLTAYACGLAALAILK